MITLKHSFFIDIKIILITIFKKSWLDKNGFYYYLSTQKKYKEINWEKLIKDINNELRNYEFLKELKGDYVVFLSKYGVFGSFYKPDIIYANIQRDSSKITLTILHEIIHLLLEKDPLFKKSNHETKEKIVENKLNEIIKKDKLNI